MSCGQLGDTGAGSFAVLLLAIPFLEFTQEGHEPVRQPPYGPPVLLS